MPGEAVYKRRRVAHACDRCREIKAKCDGLQPVCGRCAGYGYKCRWSNDRTSRVKHNEKTQTVVLDNELRMLNQRVQQLDRLVCNVRDRLCEDDRALFDVELAALQNSRLGQTSDDAETPGSSQHEDSKSQRYLGEASDIRFYNTVKQSLHPQSGDVFDQEDSGATHDCSYEQDTPSSRPRNRDLSTILPTRAVADKYIGIYFSTIHIAYPFVPMPAFEEAHNEWWKPQSHPGLSDTWTSLFLSIYAIGACYESFSGSESDSYPHTAPTHQELFEHAQATLNRHEPPRHLDYICALLAQCFYLLATSQTDRCWTTLGVAVRVAQGIGLHTEDCTSQSRHSTNDALRERQRRTWYSLYVLDQLLSLQLGRPPAIYVPFFNVCSPSTAVDVLSPSKDSGQSHSQFDQTAIGEYFLAMIGFSHVIGEALAGLYGPHKVQSPDEMLLAIEIYDTKLLQWKSELPRRLRFDLGHTFDSSIIFKRQRNMLAVKFHHLRSLIHRPCISLSRTPRSDSTNNHASPPQTQRIFTSKKICVSSSQKTAHLLYGLEDKKTLVHDFPWWQMISCLICASSILLVATLDADREYLSESADVDGIEEDADICLRVFEALSVNSNAARLARDMMQGLKETRYRIQDGHALPGRDAQAQALSRSISNHEHDLPLDQQISDMSGPSATRCSTFVPFSTVVSDAYGQSYAAQSSMPHEISEPVLWSAQFVNAEHNPFLNPLQDEMYVNLPQV